MATPILLRVSRSKVRGDARPCADVVVYSGVCARVGSRDAPADASAVSLKSVRRSRGTRRVDICAITRHQLGQEWCLV